MKRHILTAFLIISAICSPFVHAGIYKVVVLQSPDGQQRVRLYFDNHALGTIENNKTQFNIIEAAVNQLKTQKIRFDIFVESDDFYQLQEKEEDWVIVGEKPSITQDAIENRKIIFTPGTEKIWEHRSSIFTPIPYLIGKTITSDDKNIRIISIEARNLLKHFSRFINNISISGDILSFSCNILEETKSLAQTFNKTLEQLHSPYFEEIPTTESLILPDEQTKTDYVRPKRTINEKQIEHVYAILDASFEKFIQEFKKSIGDAAWKCDISCENPLSPPCYNDTQKRIINQYLDKTRQQSWWLEYDVLRHILTALAPNEIAIFVGGAHASNIQLVLEYLDYKIVYSDGNEYEEIKSFAKKEDTSLHYGIEIYYPSGRDTLIGKALQDTLVTTAIPNTIKPISEHSSKKEKEEFATALTFNNFPILFFILKKNPQLIYEPGIFFNILVTNNLDIIKLIKDILSPQEWEKIANADTGHGTPLYVTAVRERNIEMIKELLKAGANPLELTQYDFKTLDSSFKNTLIIGRINYLTNTWIEKIPQLKTDLSQPATSHKHVAEIKTDITTTINDLLTLLDLEIEKTPTPKKESGGSCVTC